MVKIGKILISLIFISGCADYTADARRPDLQYKAKKEQQAKLRQYGNN